MCDYTYSYMYIECNKFFSKFNLILINKLNAKKILLTKFCNIRIILLIIYSVSMYYILLLYTS